MYLAPSWAGSGWAWDYPGDRAGAGSCPWGPPRKNEDGGELRPGLHVQPFWAGGVKEGPPGCADWRTGVGVWGGWELPQRLSAQSGHHVLPLAGGLLGALLQPGGSGSSGVVSLETRGRVTNEQR